MTKWGVLLTRAQVLGWRRKKERNQPAGVIDRQNAFSMPRSEKCMFRSALCISKTHRTAYTPMGPETNELNSIFGSCWTKAVTVETDRFSAFVARGKKTNLSAHQIGIVHHYGGHPSAQCLQARSNYAVVDAVALSTGLLARSIVHAMAHSDPS